MIDDRYEGIDDSEELEHHGVQGMRWGVRKKQYSTPRRDWSAGKARRYGSRKLVKATEKSRNVYVKASRKKFKEANRKKVNEKKLAKLDAALKESASVYTHNKRQFTKYANAYKQRYGDVDYRKFIRSSASNLAYLRSKSTFSNAGVWGGLIASAAAGSVAYNRAYNNVSENGNKLFD